MQKPISTNSAQEVLTILVVEDNPVERQLVSKILRNADFEVITVDCGNDVLGTVIKYQPDLILLDALLPDTDGFTVCTNLRAHPKGSHLPIIMLTGLDDVLSIDRAYEVGATDFFTKPINHSLLVHRIRYSLRTRLIMDQLRISEKSLISAQQAAKLGHWELDIDKQRFRMSEGMIRMYQLQDCIMDTDTGVSKLVACCHPDDREALNEAIETSINKRKSSRIEHRIILDSGCIVFIEMHITVMQGEGDSGDHLLGISVDITDRKNSEREILQLAYCDPLTGLPNRSLLELYLDSAIPCAHLNGNSVAILSIDLDLFNRVNNSMGHSAGDAILQQLTQRLTNLLGVVDPSLFIDRLSMKSTRSLAGINDKMVSRLSGDTFVVVLSMDDRVNNYSKVLAGKIKGLFLQPFIYRMQELFVTASIGIAYSESGSSTPATLLQRADLALHDAKMQGRNEIRQFSDDLVVKVSAQLSIQSDLRKALINDELILYYQPKILLSDGSVSGLEALLRWRHPVKGMIEPSKFISIAEETGQIVEIGQWVINTACKQHKQWLDQNLIDARVAVNVSARQFKEGNLIDVVESALLRSGLSEKHLELEITEGVFMSDPNAELVLAHFRQQGIGISLDDFGTGYSSLSYITRFPIDAIKVDRCFVQDIVIGSEKAAIVSAISTLSHALNYKVIAEGVETAEELNVITQLCCDEVQGYYFCKPMSAADCCIWLKARQHTALLPSASLG